MIALSWLAHGEGLAVPMRKSAGAAGFDLCAAIAPDAVLEIGPGAVRTVPCGFAMAVPEGFEAQVRPRSGLAANHGVTVLNAPGTIDADYRGEVMVILINHGAGPFQIRRGDRIAQMVIARFEPARFEEVAALDQTARGAGGFGSTGR